MLVVTKKALSSVSLERTLNQHNFFHLKMGFFHSNVSRVEREIGDYTSLFLLDLISIQNI